MLSYVDEGTGLMVAQALEAWPAQRSRTCHALRGSAWPQTPDLTLLDLSGEDSQHPWRTTSPPCAPQPLPSWNGASGWDT